MNVFDWRLQSDLDEPYNAPVLITGCPRTGSTALVRTLSRHSRICITSEACLYDLKDSYLASRRPAPSTHLPVDVAAVCQKVWSDLRGTRSPNSEVRRSLFDAIAKTKPLQVYGDKVPDRYLRQMRRLSQRFPDARYLVTIRDGREVIASQIRWHEYATRNGRVVEWWMRPTVEAAESVWLTAMDQWERTRDAIPHERWLEVEYSAATRNPEMTLRSLCRFLSIPFQWEALRDDPDPYRPIRVGCWRTLMPTMESQLSRRFRATLVRWGFH